MKIYFAGSIRGGRQQEQYYQAIVSALKKHGEILSEIVSHSDIFDTDHENQTEQDIFNEDMSWLRDSDVVVAEVTQPSLGVGYELGQAEAMEKPILCLYRNEGAIKEFGLSAMVAGNAYFSVKGYNEVDEIAHLVDMFMNNVRKDA